MSTAVWRSVRALALALCLVAAPLQAQQTGFSYESITVAATAVGFTLSTIRPDGTPQATVCSGRLETAQIRYRWDGVAPTASTGELLEVGDRIEIQGQTNLARVLFIRTGATSGTLNMTCAR